MLTVDHHARVEPSRNRARLPAVSEGGEGRGAMRTAIVVPHATMESMSVLVGEVRGVARRAER